MAVQDISFYAHGDDPRPLGGQVASTWSRARFHCLTDASPWTRAGMQVLKNLYRGFAAGDRGALGPQEVLQVLRSALPGGVSPLAARHLLLNLKCLDLAGEARISFKDLQQVLRLVQVSAQVVNALA